MYCDFHVYSFLDLTDLKPLSDLSSRGSELIGADFNAKHPDWRGTIFNARERLLRDFLLICSIFCMHLTDGPTRFSRKTRSFIDIAMTIPEIGLIMDSAGIRTLDQESYHRTVEIGDLQTGNNDYYRF